MLRTALAFGVCTFLVLQAKWQTFCWYYSHQKVLDCKKPKPLKPGSVKAIARKEGRESLRFFCINVQRGRSQLFLPVAAKSPALLGSPADVIRE